MKDITLYPISYIVDVGGKMSKIIYAIKKYSPIFSPFLYAEDHGEKEINSFFDIIPSSILRERNRRTNFYSSLVVSYMDDAKMSLLDKEKVEQNYILMQKGDFKKVRYFSHYSNVIYTYTSVAYKLENALKEYDHLIVLIPHDLKVSFFSRKWNYDKELNDKYCEESKGAINIKPMNYVTTMSLKSIMFLRSYNISPTSFIGRQVQQEKLA